MHFARTATLPQPQLPKSCHSERSEEPAFRMDDHYSSRPQQTLSLQTPRGTAIASKTWLFCCTLLPGYIVAENHMLETEQQQRKELFRGDEDFLFLVSAIHDSFWVDLTLDELAATETVGQLYDLITTKINQPKSNDCLTSAAFYRLRSALIKLFHIPRAAITPETLLSELMPFTKRSAQREQLSAELRMLVPQLRYPIWLISMLAAAVCGWACLYAWAFWHGGSNAKLGALFGSIGILVFYLTFLSPLIAPLEAVFYSKYQTVGDLVRFLVTHDHWAFVAQKGGWNERDAMHTLCMLISEEMKVPMSLITRETRFPGGLDIR
jgi:hypothetical protein